MEFSGFWNSSPSVSLNATLARITSQLDFKGGYFHEFGISACGHFWNYLMRKWLLLLLHTLPTRQFQKPVQWKPFIISYLKNWFKILIMVIIDHGQDKANSGCPSREDVFLPVIWLFKPLVFHDDRHGWRQGWVSQSREDQQKYAA